nr:uncharacterized protein LOC100183135 [Ciona intestinalis]|eukprot:XP_018667475.1 uncharacterized protein LOC100183135 [Ciona intestinalis]
MSKQHFPAKDNLNDIVLLSQTLESTNRQSLFLTQPTPNIGLETVANNFPSNTVSSEVPSSHENVNKSRGRLLNKVPRVAELDIDIEAQFDSNQPKSRKLDPTIGDLNEYGVNLRSSKDFGLTNKFSGDGAKIEPDAFQTEQFDAKFINQRDRHEVHSKAAAKLLLDLFDGSTSTNKNKTPSVSNEIAFNNLKDHLLPALQYFKHNSNNFLHMLPEAFESDVNDLDLEKLGMNKQKMLYGYVLLNYLLSKDYEISIETDGKDNKTVSSLCFKVASSKETNQTTSTIVPITIDPITHTKPVSQSNLQTTVSTTIIDAKTVKFAQEPVPIYEAFMEEEQFIPVKLSKTKKAPTKKNSPPKDTTPNTKTNVSVTLNKLNNNQIQKTKKALPKKNSTEKAGTADTFSGESNTVNDKQQTTQNLSHFNSTIPVSTTTSTRITTTNMPLTRKLASTTQHTKMVTDKLPQDDSDFSGHSVLAFLRQHEKMEASHQEASGSGDDAFEHSDDHYHGPHADDEMMEYSDGPVEGYYYSDHNYDEQVQNIGSGSGHSGYDGDTNEPTTELPKTEEENCMGIPNKSMTPRLTKCCEALTVNNTDESEFVSECMATQLTYLYGLDDQVDIEAIDTRSHGSRCICAGRKKVLNSICCLKSFCHEWPKPVLKSLCNVCQPFCQPCSWSLLFG